MTFTNRLFSKIKRTSIDLLFFTNLQKVIISGKKVNKIIMYHGVDLYEEKKFNSRFIGLENFKKQILFFKKHCNVISLQDFFEQKFDSTKSNIALTFDDGFINNYNYAVPFLNQLEAPATIYVTALNETSYDILWPDYLDLASYFMNVPVEIEGIIFQKNQAGKYYSNELTKTLNQLIKEKGSFTYKETVFREFEKHAKVDFKKDPKYFDYWKLMNNKQLIEVDQSKYVKIESHAYWHNNLGNIPIDSAKKELIDSKKYLENLLQREINEIAYPDGSYTRNLIDCAEEIGFKYQLAADGYHFDDDILDSRIIDRTGLYPSVSWCNQLYNIYD